MAETNIPLYIPPIDYARVAAEWKVQVLHWKDTYPLSDDGRGIVDTVIELIERFQRLVLKSVDIKDDLQDQMAFQDWLDEQISDRYDQLLELIEHVRDLTVHQPWNNAYYEILKEDFHRENHDAAIREPVNQDSQ